MSESQPVDLTNCDREPIHIPGQVQSFGCLLAISADWIIVHASSNVAEFLGVEPAAIIGSPLKDLLGGEAVHELRTAVQLLSGADAVERLFDLQTEIDRDKTFDIATHRSGSNIIFELQPHTAGMKKDSLSLVRPMIDRLKQASTVETMCRTAARHVKALTGFDRVMVYRFLPDESGEVLAEAADPKLEPFLGLRYPASDIPRQARELYRRNLLRIISDVDQPTSPITPVTNPAGEPLDLSMSVLRAVSPIHIEYLQNMGVKASMSISILCRGRLWGLFACHHYSPRVLEYDVRTTCELFAQMFGFVLDQLVGDLLREETKRTRTLHNRLMSQLAESTSVADNFEAIAEALGEAIEYDGVVGWLNGEYTARGLTPTRDEFASLARFLNTTQGSRIYATDCLHKAHPPAADYVERGAGLLAIPVSRSPRDYIVLFRQEVANTVTWAGNPEKPAELGPNGVRLTPRKSFEAWRETVHGCCKPWKESEVETAESLRVTLLEVVLRMSDAANQDRLRAQQSQELLIAELNHRVRNILNLIRGLVNQSAQDAESVAEFTKTVGGRIHALARAHDQITQKSWAPSSLKSLLRTELTAYLADKVDRIEFSGWDAQIEAEAFTTLALVFHELMTNSAKYGALSDSTGVIVVDFLANADNSLAIRWTEKDGPTVKPPLRKGFGTTIIERSIPFELGGASRINYHLTGLVAEFTVPAKYISKFVDGNGEESVAAPNTEGAAPLVVEVGRTLIVEDNLIIALDAEEHLRKLGVRDITVASSVDEALRIVHSATPDFAILDVNLGDVSSLPIARELRRRSIPFVFASGYGEAGSLVAEFEDVSILSKPYDAETLSTVITKRLSGDGG